MSKFEAPKPEKPSSLKRKVMKIAGGAALLGALGAGAYEADSMPDDNSSVQKLEKSGFGERFGKKLKQEEIKKLLWRPFNFLDENGRTLRAIEENDDDLLAIDALPKKRERIDKNEGVVVSEEIERELFDFGIVDRLLPKNWKFDETVIGILVHRKSTGTIESAEIVLEHSPVYRMTKTMPSHLIKFERRPEPGKKFKILINGKKIEGLEGVDLTPSQQRDLEGLMNGLNENLTRLNTRALELKKIYKRLYQNDYPPVMPKAMEDEYMSITGHKIDEGEGLNIVNEKHAL